MKRQPNTLGCELWSSPCGCILAIDALGGEPPSFWIEGQRAWLESKGLYYLLGELNLNALAMASSGRLAVVEFSATGPVRETHLSTRRQTG